MEQILSSDNLNRAYLQVVRNKGAEGVDGMKYTKLKEHLEKNGEVIKEQLRTRKYKPQPVRRVEIPKADGGVRNLGVPTVTDRFVQQAIAQVLTPIYEEQFHDHSYGFRPNRCAQQAILKALEMMNDGNEWIVDIDLEKFFDTVNHDKLMTIIGRTIKDGDVISIVRKFLVSGIMIDDEYEESVVGTPQGGNLSPLLANIMLNELDKEMEKRGLNFVRYADDCIIMVGSEMSANRVMRNISRFIEEKLGLKVNMTKSKVDKPWGLNVDRKIELTQDRQIKLTHLVIKSPLRGGGKRGGQHVQMAAHQGTARSRGRHQANSKGCWGVQEYRQEVP
jgi:group II intron reverse transcriptase/maturase